MSQQRSAYFCCVFLPAFNDRWISCDYDRVDNTGCNDVHAEPGGSRVIGTSGAAGSGLVSITPTCGSS
jgi:hypothetical protein